MRSLKVGLIAFAATAILVSWAVVGCSASGTGDTGDGLGTDSGTDGSTPLPPGDDSGGPINPPPKDGGKPDSGFDAGTPPPNPGDPCSKLDQVAAKPCGACGTQQALCEVSPDAGVDAGGPLVWSDYGQCNNELMGGCIPGTTEACGNCGMHTCSKYCAWGSCAGEPAGACTPGSIDYTNASCTAPNTYKSRTCGTMCTYGGYTVSCAPPDNPNKMSISGSVGGTTTNKYTWSTSALGEALQAGFGGMASCPGTIQTNFTTGASDPTYPQVAVEIDNPTAKTATVTVYLSKAGTLTDASALMWIYKKAIPPTNDANLAACDYGVAGDCNTYVIAGNANICGGSGSEYWAGISNVVIKPGDAILVYAASAQPNSEPPAQVGDFNLNVKTDSLK